MNQDWLTLQAYSFRPFLFQLRPATLYSNRLPRKDKKRLKNMGINWKMWPEVTL